MSFSKILTGEAGPELWRNTNRKRKRESDEDEVVEIPAKKRKRESDENDAAVVMRAAKKRKRERDEDEVVEIPAKKRKIERDEDQVVEIPAKKRKIERDEDEVEILERAAKRTAATIQQIKVHANLGEGSSGKVVLASCPSDNQLLAVKIIPKPGNEDNLKQERDILLQAKESPFLCHAHAAFQNQDKAYFMMEYLPGGCLLDLLQMSKNLALNTVQFYTAEIVCGLQHLHTRGIVHRDIKLENIMLDKDGHIKIIDMGVAHQGLQGSTKIRGQIGTLTYMAPEILKNQSYGKEVDWWALGIMVCELLTGANPFYDGPNNKRVRRTIIQNSPYIPGWLDYVTRDFLLKLLEKNPTERLGVKGNIREHPFFQTINWEELEAKRVTPPFRPFLSLPEMKRQPGISFGYSNDYIHEFDFLFPN